MESSSNSGDESSQLQPSSACQDEAGVDDPGTKSGSDDEVSQVCSTAGSSTGSVQEKTAVKAPFSWGRYLNKALTSVPQKRKEIPASKQSGFFCVDCGHKLSQKKGYTGKRHATQMHRHDSAYDWMKSIVSVDSPLYPPTKKLKTSSNVDPTPDISTVSKATISKASTAPAQAGKPSQSSSALVSDQSPSNVGSSSDTSTQETTTEDPEEATKEDSEEAIEFTSSTSRQQVAGSSFHEEQDLVTEESSCSATLPQMDAVNVDSLSETRYAHLSSQLLKIQNDMKLLMTSIKQERKNELPRETYIMNVSDIQELKKSKTIGELVLNSQCMVEENLDGGNVRLYCKPCREQFGLEGRVEKGCQNVSSKEICMGLNIKANVDSNISAFAELKRKLIGHVLGTSNSGDAHLLAIQERTKKEEKELKILSATRSLMRCGLTVIKMKSAARHYEQLLSVVDAEGGNVGTINHSRNMIQPISKTFVGHIRLALRDFLTTELPSTGFPPHYGSASDKSTPGRETNHAILVLFMKNGKRLAVPTGSPKVYQRHDTGALGSLKGGTAYELGLQVCDSLCEFALLTNERLSYHMATQADGQYQAEGFRQALMERCKVDENDSDFMPVVWDGSHWMDLAFSDVRLKSDCKDFLKVFIDRCNSFADMFGRGRGVDEYLAATTSLKVSSSVVSHFSTTRFFSSAVKVLESLYGAYSGYIATFIEVRQTDDDCDMMKYKVRGSDFALELCLLLDIFDDLKEVMVKLQSLQSNIWLPVELVPRLMARLQEREGALKKITGMGSLKNLPARLYPRTKENAEDLLAGKFKGHELLEGWLVKPSKNKKGDKVVVWEQREFDEIIDDVKNLTSQLRTSISDRYDSSVSPLASMLNNCINPLKLVQMVCGDRKSPNERPRLTTPTHILYRTAGRKDFANFYAYVCRLPHIIKKQEEENLEFHEDLAPEIYGKLPAIVYDGVWGKASKLKSWFPKTTASPAKLVSLSCDESTLVPSFAFTFSDGREEKSFFSEENFFKEFYCDEEVYKRAGKELCTALDVALAKGGCEAVAESYYSVMKAQQTGLHMKNDTLEDRTIIDWCLPIAYRCPNTLEDVARLYLRGNDDLNLPKHRAPVHTDIRERSSYAETSKVLQRLKEEPFELDCLLSVKDRQ